MTQEHFFGDAKWMGASDRTAETFSVLRGRFYVASPQKVSLNILGLGFFKCYINGVCINPDTFLPLSSDYEASCDPKGQILSGHRVYVPDFDITPFVKVGENPHWVRCEPALKDSLRVAGDSSHAFIAFLL